jgi:hypothetical protein
MSSSTTNTTINTTATTPPDPCIENPDAEGCIPPGKGPATLPGSIPPCVLTADCPRAPPAPAGQQPAQGPLGGQGNLQAPQDPLVEPATDPVDGETPPGPTDPNDPIFREAQQDEDIEEVEDTEEVESEADEGGGDGGDE